MSEQNKKEISKCEHKWSWSGEVMLYTCEYCKLQLTPDELVALKAKTIIPQSLEEKDCACGGKRAWENHTLEECFTVRTSFGLNNPVYIETPPSHPPTDSNCAESVLKKFLAELEENVFIKSTNSVSGEEEHLEPIVEDMEAVIAISGEWDREDLKKILVSLSSNKPSNE